MRKGLLAGIFAIMLLAFGIHTGASTRPFPANDIPPYRVGVKMKRTPSEVAEIKESAMFVVTNEVYINPLRSQSNTLTLGKDERANKEEGSGPSKTVPQHARRPEPQVTDALDPFSGGKVVSAKATGPSCQQYYDRKARRPVRVDGDQNQKTQVFTIYFELGSAIVEPGLGKKLTSALNIAENATVEVHGFTCPLGSDKTNRVLAAGRAQNVAKLLREGGVKHLTVKARPKCCYKSTTELWKNRRVEIVVNPGA